MRIHQPAPRDTPENVVPLINIVFLLLMFFLLAGTLAPRPPVEFEPVTTALQPAADPPAGAVYVAADGRLFYGEGEVTLDTLGETLRKELNEGAREDAPLQVVLDRRLRGAALFAVIEALSGAGVERMTLITDRDAGP